MSKNPSHMLMFAGLNGFGKSKIIALFPKALSEVHIEAADMKQVLRHNCYLGENKP